MPKHNKNKNAKKGRTQRENTESFPVTNDIQRKNTSVNGVDRVEIPSSDTHENQSTSNQEKISLNNLTIEVENLSLDPQDHIENKNMIPSSSGGQSQVNSESRHDSPKKFKSLNLNINISPTMRMGFLPQRPDKGGSKGRSIPLIINCLNVNINPMKVYMYDIELTKAELLLSDKVRDFTNKIKRKEIFRDVVSKFLKDKCGRPVFDGGRIIFTNQMLPYSEDINKFDFEYNYENQKIICYLNLQYINNDLDLNEINDYISSGNGHSDNLPQECIRILDMIIREVFLDRNLIAIGTKGIFDPNTSQNFTQGPYEIMDGYFTTIRPHMSKIRFNFDKTQIVCHQPINLMDYIEKLITLKKFNISNIKSISHKLFNLRVRADYYKNAEGKGYSSSFMIKGVYNKNAEEEIIEDLNESVYSYFQSRHGIKLKYPELLLIEMTNRNKFPVEVLTVLPNQKVFGNNPNIVRDVIKYSAVSCDKRLKNLENAIKKFEGFRGNKYLKDYNIQIDSNLIIVLGRILDEPTALFGGKEEKLPKSKFNLMNKKFKNPFNEPIIWALFAFGDQKYYGNEQLLYDVEKQFPNAARKVNVNVHSYYGFEYVTTNNIEETVNKTLNQLKMNNEQLDLLLFVIRNDEEYKIVKDVGDIKLGIVTQCINYANLSRQKNLSQYMGNIMLKINAKLGGTNWEIKNIQFESIKGSFMVFGIDVTHPSSIANVLSKSVAAVVGSINSTATVYSAIIRQQKSKDDKDIVEIVIEMEDMVFQLLKAFFDLNNSQLPEHLIFYRDGVSEGQFELVFSHEIQAIKYACEKLKKNYKPKITYIVVQKRHKIRFFPKNPGDSIGNSKNVPAGVVVDQDITHSREFDFYLCSHEGIQGTSKPVHYHVLFDENKWKSDDLQHFSYFLCYLCFRCTRSISYPAPTYYAHLAAFRGRILKDDADNISISNENENEIFDSSEISINEFHQNKMFFI